MTNNYDYFLEYDDSEKAKEIYARFGLCVYFFQVLEHQLINMLLIKARAVRVHSFQPRLSPVKIATNQFK